MLDRAEFVSRISLAMSAVDAFFGKANEEKLGRPLWAGVQRALMAYEAARRGRDIDEASRWWKWIDALKREGLENDAVEDWIAERGGSEDHLYPDAYEALCAHSELTALVGQEQTSFWWAEIDTFVCAVANADPSRLPGFDDT